jgi:hypothetical protein
MGYTLLFKSLKGTDYRLIIDGGGTLIDGAASAFETTEDANADMFTPVRTQNGYFRFIGHNDHSTWLGMIPIDALSKPVKLYTSNVIKWQGFITPQVYQNEFPGIGTQIHEIPVQCPLSVLDTIDVDTNINNHPVVTFGQLLQNYIFNAVTTAGDNDHISITGYYIQGTATVTAARLNLKVMWANFVETDSTGALKPKYTYKQVLEEFCKFFGYTCRMHGSTVYFTMPVTHSGQSEVGFTYYGASGLWNSSTGQASAGTYAARGSFSITDDMLVDTNNNEEVNPGVGKVTVRSDINVLDNLVEIPYDEIYDQYNVGVPNNNIIIRALDQGDEKIYYLIKNPDSNGLALTYENDSVEMTCYSAKFDGEALTENKYCRFLTFDSSEVGDPDTQELPESKKAYGWKYCIELFHGTEYTGSDNTTMFTITSKQVFVVSGGVLYVSWKMQDTDANLYKIAYGQMSGLLPRLTAQLRVGDKYWHGVWDVQNRMWQVGAGWTTTPSTFTMYLDSDGPKTTRRFITDPQYDGFGVPVEGTMRGVLEFKIIDVHMWQSSWPIGVDNNGFVPMHDFEIGFVRGVIEDTKHRGNEYVKSAGAFRGETNVDLIFASDVPYGNNNFVRRMPAGLGYILDVNEIPTEKILSMSGADVIAEEELAEVMAAYGNHTHRLVQLDLRTTLLGAVDPTKMSATSEAGMSDIAGMFPLAIGHNWRDDVTILTLIAL